MAKITEGFILYREKDGLVLRNTFSNSEAHAWSLFQRIYENQPRMSLNDFRKAMIEVGWSLRRATVTLGVEVDWPIESTRQKG